MYRKPNGEYTEDAEEMTDAWLQLAAPIEAATGWKLYAFDPDLAFHGPAPETWRTVKLPVKFAQALVSALQEADFEPPSLASEKKAQEQNDMFDQWKSFMEDDAMWVKVNSVDEAKQINLQSIPVESFP